MRRRDFIIITVFVGLLIGVVGVAVMKGIQANRINLARVKDLQALRSVCNTVSNIDSTEALLTKARQWGVVLQSPIAKDPSKPCYVLVNPMPSSTNAIEPAMILISETNTTDSNTTLVLTMDGTVQALPHAAAQ